jgi:hypothetical protein
MSYRQIWLKESKSKLLWSYFEENKKNRDPYSNDDFERTAFYS